MEAYYTQSKTQRQRRKFVYIKLNLEDAKKIFAGIKNYEGGKEIHMTTDNVFDTYIEKRREVPLFVQICSTRKELDKRLELINVYL